MFLLFALLAVVMGGGDDEVEVTGTRVVPRPPKRQVKMTQARDEPGLRVFDEAAAWMVGDENAGTWWPGYARQSGVKDLRWGVCMDTIAHDIMKRAEASGGDGAGISKAVRIHDAIALWVTNFWQIGDVGVGDIAQWVKKQLCLRFKWPLMTYKVPFYQKDPAGSETQRYWEVDRVEQNLYPPKHPLPEVEGWNRVWINEIRNPTRLASKTRNVEAMLVYFPTVHQTVELLTKSTVRALLRFDTDTQPTGSISSGDLAGAAFGKSKFWPARSSKAEPEYAGEDDA